MRDLLSINSDIIVNTIIDGKKIGVRIAKGLAQYQNINKQLWVNILKEVNGVSKSKAFSIMGYVDKIDDFKKIPSMTIDGKKIENPQSLDGFVKLIDKAIKAKQASPGN